MTTFDIATEVFKPNDWGLWRIVLIANNGACRTELKIRAESEAGVRRWVALHRPDWTFVVDENGLPLIFREDRAQR